MKLKFSLRTLLAVMLVCACGVGYWQYSNTNGSNVFLQLLQSMDTRFIYSPNDSGTGTPGKVGDDVDPVAVENPSWQRKLFGDTKLVPGGIRFYDSITAEQSRRLARNRSGDQVLDLALRRLKLDADASYFPGNWDNLRAVEFDDVNLPEAWKRGIVESSQHIKTMGFYGSKTDIGLNELMQLGHLERLVISNLQIDLRRLPELRKALPNTQVIVSVSLGSKLEQLAAYSEHDPSQTKAIRATAQEVRDRAKKEAIPEYPTDSIGYSQDEIRKLEASMGFVLPPALRAYLEVGSAQFFWDNSISVFGYSKLVPLEGYYDREGFKTGSWVEEIQSVPDESAAKVTATWEANPFGTNSSVSLHHWSQARYRQAICIGKSEGEIFVDLESGEIIFSGPPQSEVILGSTIHDHIMVQLEYRRFAKRRKKDLIGNPRFGYRDALKRIVSRRMAEERAGKGEGTAD